MLWQSSSPYLGDSEVVMGLYLRNLEKSVQVLKRSLSVLEQAEDQSRLDDDVLETLRAGVIQHFEVTYEVSWKLIQRWLKINVSSDDFEIPRTRKDLFRAAARYGLIDKPEPWFNYSEARNTTSHLYNEKKAADVLAVARKFFSDAEALLLKLEELND